MEGFRFTFEQQVVFRDIDMLGHVNNAVYATYFETARVEYLHNLTADLETLVTFILAEITITYKSPAYLRERLVIGLRVTEIGNSSMVFEGRIVEKETGRLVATSRAVLVHFDYKNQRPVPVPAELRARIGRFEGREF
ncbi:acyl-CoA thioester hydrolase [Symbiobacterium terraclitae]|uniref:Acyl-CoA thioester hydrolase n=1 Tax=Symbiobacterium terraclitae TaxID=557451 RepID=A0ABS4JTD5_9FIRM|nr:acyl-CoA thioester hydrolase [Symbiobacterium terraclitae]